MLPILSALRSFRLWAGIGGYLIAAFFFWAWVNGKEELAAETESCNTQKTEAVAEAERVTRDAQERAFETRLADLRAQADSEAKAREIAESARLAAESRPERVRTIIREVADANACINIDVPERLVDGLRS